MLRALELDGFTFANGELRRTLPSDVQLPETENELVRLLKKHGLVTSNGHLDQVAGERKAVRNMRTAWHTRQELSIFVLLVSLPYLVADDLSDAIDLDLVCTADILHRSNDVDVQRLAAVGAIDVHSSGLAHNLPPFCGMPRSSRERIMSYSRRIAPFVKRRMFTATEQELSFADRESIVQLGGLYSMQSLMYDSRVRCHPAHETGRERFPSAS